MDEPIIHLIQSFLTPKEAAQTTLLSKSWNSAWSTRPTLALDETLFEQPDPYCSPEYAEIDPLTAFATNTFRRYEESNRSIDTFSLRLKSDWYHHPAGLAARWILKALHMGATRLTLRFKGSCSNKLIPMNEVFGSENLLGLCIDSVHIHPHLMPKVIKCSRLKSLTLSSTDISTASILNIILCCPLIENLSLVNIFDIRAEPDVSPKSTGSSKLRLRKLATLVLDGLSLEVEKLFLDDLTSKFPNLKDLTLVRFESKKRIQIISSRSLEILNLKMRKIGWSCNVEIYEYEYEDGEMPPQVVFDVPSIRMFTYEGEYMTRMSFRSTPAYQWESRVSLTHNDELSIKWFCELSKFLSQLRGSKMHLCLHVDYSESFDYQPGDIKGSEVCEVEDLTMDTTGLPFLSCDALLDGLFRICRPMMITQYVSPPYKDDVVDHDGYSKRQNYEYTENTLNDDFSLWQALEQGVNVKSFLTSQFMYGLSDLEEVNAQMLFEDVWMPHPFDAVLDSMYDKSVRSEQRRYRFLLKWKSLLA